MLNEVTIVSSSIGSHRGDLQSYCPKTVTGFSIFYFLNIYIMKAKISSMLIIALLTASCQNSVGPDLVEDSQNLNFEELSGIQHDIAVNILTSKFGGYKKGTPKTRTAEFSITPYVLEGDTTMFIVQYPDGWEIYSANHATDMVLFSAEHGNYVQDMRNAPESFKLMIENNARIISGIPDTTTTINPSWGIAGVTQNDLDLCKTIVRTKNGIKVLSNTEEYPPGKWILMETEDLGTTVYTSNKLTQTSWNQKFPYNLYSEKVINTKDGKLASAVAGCAPVALAQYMYYTHYLNGTPSASVTTATPTTNGLDFTFSGSSSSIWDEMQHSYSYWGGEEVALLIGKIGHDLNAEYGAEGTSVITNNIAPYLSNIYNTNYPLQDFNYAYIKRSINKNLPVITHAYSNQDNNGQPSKNTGHTFLTDQYRETTQNRKATYRLERDPWPSGIVDPWESDEVDPEGNVIGYAYIKEVIITTNTYEVSTNWGDYEFMNNIFHSASGYWTVGINKI